MVFRAHEVTTVSNQITYTTMQAKKPLGLTDRFETLHPSFPATLMMVGILRTIVRIPPRVMHGVGKSSPDRGRKGNYPIRYQSRRFLSLAGQYFSNEAFGHLTLAATPV